MRENYWKTGGGSLGTMQKLHREYLALISILAVVLWGLLFFGNRNIELSQEGGTAEKAPEVVHGPAASDVATFFTVNANRPISILFAQLICIILVARVVGFCFQKLGQPAVIGEMTAGIILGPSLLGYFYPGFTAALFPESSLPALRVMSQLGVVLYMFLVGLEFNADELAENAMPGLFISHTSILFQLCVGVALATMIFSIGAGTSATFVSFALFLGVTLGISAFPVLARILKDRGLAGTAIGGVVFSAALADELTAWSLLAVVNTMTQSGSLRAALTGVGVSVLFVLFLLFIARPLLDRLYRWLARWAVMDAGSFAVVILFLLGTSLITRVLGVHVFVGAFLAGVVMPRGKELHGYLQDKLHPFTSVVLLPLFFAFTGVRTDLTLLGNIQGGIGLVGVVLLAACGKFAVTAVATRLHGQTWSDSLRAGTLLNTRGLMELIVINIGYDLGIFSKELFAVLVLMALVTTFATGPVLQLIERCSPAVRRDAIAEPRVTSSVEKPGS